MVEAFASVGFDFREDSGEGEFLAEDLDGAGGFWFFHIPLRDGGPASMVVEALVFEGGDPFVFVPAIEGLVIVGVVIEDGSGVVADDVLDDADALAVGELDEIPIVSEASFAPLGISGAVERGLGSEMGVDV